MSSIRMIEGGKPSKEVKSVSFIMGKQLVADGLAVYANLPAPKPQPQPTQPAGPSEEVKALEAQIDRERREKAAAFAEKQEMEARLAALEAQVKASQTQAPQGGSNHGGSQGGNHGGSNSKK